MLSILIGLILSAIFLFLSGVHFYWGLGGKWGINVSIPTKENNEKLINPKLFHCFLIAFGLLICAVFVLIKVGIISFALPHFIIKDGLSVIAGIFIIRAVGEFKYVGFFKKVKNTRFGQMDTKYYSPLCLCIGLMGILLELLN